MEKISLGDITVSVKLRINGKYGRTFIVLIKRKAYILKITDGFSEMITSASHMPHLFKLGTLNYDKKQRAYYLYKFIDGHFISDLPLLTKELLASFIEMAKEIDELEFAIVDMDATNILLSKNKKFYFVDHDGIMPKSIAFSRDVYPYKSEKEITNKNTYDVQTEIYYLGLFLYDLFISKNRCKGESVSGIVNTMISLDKNERYQNFDEILKAIN